MVDHIFDASEPRGRVAIQVGAGRRRRWSDEVKGRIVAESYAPGAVVSEVARRHGISPQHLFVWRKAARAGVLSLPADEAPLFVPVVTEPRRWDGRGSGNTELDNDQHRDWRCGGSRVGRGRPGVAARCAAGREGSHMIAASAGVKIMVATKPVDFRKGADGLAALMHEQLRHDPFAGTIFVFRSKRADRLKILAWDGSGLVLLWKRLEHNAFRWPPISDGVMRLSASQLAALMDGMDWSRLHARDVAQPTATS
jgi:transposase